MAGQSHKVSVIIPVYNTLDYLPEAVESVLSQDYSNFEVIMVDDGSTRPGAKEIASRYGGKVRFFRKNNGGVASARNLGIAHAAGDFIALLDQDDRWLPGKLSAQVPLFDDPGVGLAYGAIRFFQTQDNRTLGHYFPGHPLGFHDILGHTVLTTQTLIFRRSVLEIVGGFDDSLHGTDDWDACIRVAARAKLYGINSILAEARIHGSNNTGKLDMYGGAMAVLGKNSAIHPNCRECGRAMNLARGRLREARYNSLCGRSRAALLRGGYVEAARLRWAAARLAPTTFLRRLNQRAFGMLTGRDR